MIRKVIQEQCSLVPHSTVEECKTQWQSLTEDELQSFDQECVHSFVQRSVDDINAFGYYSPQTHPLVSHFLTKYTHEVLAQVLCEDDMKILLQRYFYAFDRILFGSCLAKLGDRVVFYWVPFGPHYDAINKDAKNWGRACYIYPPGGPVFGLDRSNLLIHIYVFEREGASGATGFLLYLGTLLHEMVHALYMAYSCLCKQCFVGHNHRTGHVLWWQKTALAVEEVVRSKFRLPISLGRIMAYGYECYGEGRISGSWLNDELIKELKLDYNKVAMAKWRFIIESKERQIGVAIPMAPASYERMIKFERETSEMLHEIGSRPRKCSRVEDDDGGSVDARGLRDAISTEYIPFSLKIPGRWLDTT